MISIGERVKRCIDDMQQEKYLFALEQMSIAIDMTAKKYYQKVWSSRTIYNDLVKEYSWLLELMAFNINFEKSKFGNFPFKHQNKDYTEPTFQDLMYNIIRCGLIHGNKCNIRFHSEDYILIAKDLLILPARLVYGLLGIVVFCKSNKNETTADGYYLSIYDQKFTINGWWGMEEYMKSRFEEHITHNPKIILNIPHSHFHQPQQDTETK